MQAAEGRQQWTLTFGSSEIRSRAAWLNQDRLLVAKVLTLSDQQNVFEPLIFQVQNAFFFILKKRMPKFTKPNFNSLSIHIMQAHKVLDTHSQAVNADFQKKKKVFF